MSFNRTLSNKYKLNRNLEALDLSTFNSSNQLTFNLSNQKVNINTNTPTNDRTYTIPDIGSDGTFVISGGNTPIISGSLIPSVNDTYDLGSSSYGWRYIYSAGNRLFLGYGADYTVLTAQNQTGTDINTLTLPSTTDTICTVSYPQTLSNKTLNTPTLNTPYFTGVSTGIIQSSSQYCFSYYLASNLTGVTGNNSIVVIAPSSLEYQNGSDYSPTTGQFTCTVPGKYRFTLSVSSSAYNGSENYAALMILYNATTYYIVSGKPMPSGSGYLTMQGFRTFNLKNGDIISAAFIVGGSSTNNITIQSGITSTWFQGEMLSCA